MNVQALWILSITLGTIVWNVGQHGAGAWRISLQQWRKDSRKTHRAGTRNGDFWVSDNLEYFAIWLCVAFSNICIYFCTFWVQHMYDEFTWFDMICDLTFGCWMHIFHNCTYDPWAVFLRVGLYLPCMSEMSETVGNVCSVVSRPPPVAVDRANTAIDYVTRLRLTCIWRRRPWRLRGLSIPIPGAWRARSSKPKSRKSSRCRQSDACVSSLSLFECVVCRFFVFRVCVYIS